LKKRSGRETLFVFLEATHYSNSTQETIADAQKGPNYSQQCRFSDLQAVLLKILVDGLHFNLDRTAAIGTTFIQENMFVSGRFPNLPEARLSVCEQERDHMTQSLTEN